MKANKTKQLSDNKGKRTISIAPMLDWTDRHYRYFARQITHHAWVYSEMVTTGALLYGQAERFLTFDQIEHPIALQLGGSEPEALAKCTKLAAQYGYDEVNLNCGCPSPRVQKGAFGACLMGEVPLVISCLKAMQDVADIEVTIKHRVGIDKQDNYSVVRDFVGTLAKETYCKTFIVHARNAWLEGLSPKENRETPSLRYEYVYQLKQDFPDLEIIINGGIKTNDQIIHHLLHVDGVMIGREAYYNPYVMADWDVQFYQDAHPVLSRQQIVENLIVYCHKQLHVNDGTTMRHMVKHFLGLMQGQIGARAWRRILSDTKELNQATEALLLKAASEVSLKI